MNRAEKIKTLCNKVVSEFKDGKTRVRIEQFDNGVKADDMNYPIDFLLNKGDKPSWFLKAYFDTDYDVELTFS